MLTNNELKQAFNKAVEEGYITNLENHAECIANEDDSEPDVCNDCPANTACRQLSMIDGKSTYDNFKKNFDKLYKG